MINEEALRAQDVATMLHIGKNAVYALAKAGELPSYRLGRKLLFSRDDVAAYLAAAKQGDAGAPKGRPAATVPASLPGGSGEGAAVIAGSDMAADVLANYLNAAGVPVRRQWEGSYQSLVSLYEERADAALVHLYDQRSNSYNVPYVQRLAPGAPVVVMHLSRRPQGFAVAAGNPKAIASWGALLRTDVRVANRRRGTAARILLDEKLLAIEAVPAQIPGYGREAPSALAAAETVAAGAADVAIVQEHIARTVPGLDFVPLQHEWLDLVIAKRPSTRNLVRCCKALIEEGGFRRDLGAVGHGDVGSAGAIVYEC
ncbi:helix-turn-helix transcriptional regulator [uncultured Adlercreutzia sp.]|uniref:helix-turn-helix transcriptional regulator n=1 Tax=uncultured Adlercreutzia sp. TaxID=875803 RepID=UPI00267601BD|nr:helix-turn-helix transcriptional regulator [uncultured Adlercreutzia sp.]